MLGGIVIRIQGDGKLFVKFREVISFIKREFIDIRRWEGMPVTGGSGGRVKLRSKVSVLSINSTESPADRETALPEVPARSSVKVMEADPFTSLNVPSKEAWKRRPSVPCSVRSCTASPPENSPVATSLPALSTVMERTMDCPSDWRAVAFKISPVPGSMDATYPLALFPPAER